MSEEQESYLVPKPPKTPQGEQVWCKIGEKGELEYADWEAIEQLAVEYDKATAKQRNDRLLIAKLMWLTRQVTIKELTGQR
jgi:hypothetical protein